MKLKKKKLKINALAISYTKLWVWGRFGGVSGQNSTLSKRFIDSFRNHGSDFDPPLHTGDQGTDESSERKGHGDQSTGLLRGGASVATAFVTQFCAYLEYIVLSY